MTRDIERARAGYDAREVEYGVVYRWCPASVLVECDCGERAVLTRTGPFVLAAAWPTRPSFERSRRPAG